MKDYDDKKLKSVTKEGLDIDETDDEKRREKRRRPNLRVSASS